MRRLVRVHPLDSEPHASDIAGIVGAGCQRVNARPRSLKRREEKKRPTMLDTWRYMVASSRLLWMCLGRSVARRGSDISVAKGALRVALSRRSLGPHSSSHARGSLLD
jgi:hypothetical protein